MKLNWCDRTLVISPVYYTLATSPAILKKEMKRFKVNQEIGINNGKSATTNIMKNDNGEVVAIVCLYDHSVDILMIYALLVHEAVHIWQEIKENIGEREPSHEFEAYSIQKISQNLFYEYKRQVGGKRGKRTR